MALLEPIHVQLSNYVRAMAGSGDDAKDIMSDTILRAYEQFDTVRKPESFRYFLFTIARRRFLHGIHRDRIFTRLTDEHGDNLPSRQPGPELAAEIRELYEAMARLPEQQREAVALFELAGFPLKDVARLQNSSVPAVKVRLMRGRRKLAELLRMEDAISDTALQAAGGEDYE